MRTASWVDGRYADRGGPGGDAGADPADCVDWFDAAYWHHPLAYLDPAIRRPMSALAMIPGADRERGLHHLRGDLESGDWHRH